MRDALSVPDDGPINVRAALIDAQRARTRVDLQPLSGADGASPAATIEMVLDTTFLITRPMVGGVVRLLGRYERYRMVFNGGDGRLAGETQALGRTRIPNDAGEPLYGYKMRLPETLLTVDRRRGLRRLLGRDLVREAELHVLGRRGPILGLVDTLDAGGATLRCRNAGDHLHHGQNAEFKITLPDPVGVIEETVQVTDLTPAPEPGVLQVRVLFLKRNETIGDVLRQERR